jgi:hypothetical protein
MDEHGWEIASRDADFNRPFHPLLIRVHRRSSGAPRQGEPIWRGYYNIGYELEESDCPE